MKKWIAILLAGLLLLACIGTAAAEEAYGFQGTETIEEQLLYEENGLKVTTAGLTAINDIPVLKLEIENTAGKAFCFHLMENAINDWEWDASLCTYDEAEATIDETYDLTVEDGGTLACGLDFANEYYYSLCGIKGVGKISFRLHVCDPDSGETFFCTPALELPTSLGADLPGTYADTGSLAYETGDVRIVMAGLNEEFDSAHALIYINNYSDVPVEISAENCTVNGQQVEAWFSAQVFPGRQCLAEMGFSEDFAEIHELSAAFRVEEYAPYEDGGAKLIGLSDIVQFEY